MMPAMSQASWRKPRRDSPVHRTANMMAPMGKGTGPKKLLLVNHCSPGDVLMLTAAVRDLHRAYPGEYLTGVDTYCPDLWQNNPHVQPIDGNDPEVLRIDCN